MFKEGIDNHSPLSKLMAQCGFKGNPILRFFFRLCLIYNLEKGKPDRKEREKAEKESGKRRAKAKQATINLESCSDEDSINDRCFLILSLFSSLLPVSSPCFRLFPFFSTPPPFL